MVSAAIAYDELRAKGDDEIIDAVGAILERHPDRGPFEVAIDRETGAARTKRLFLECARWPDDSRGTPFDHPTWHAAMSPIAIEPSSAKSSDVFGEALEAYALHVRTLTNRQASPSDRAVSLCWVMHLTGDVHQPLHAAQALTIAQPEGDRGGGLVYVKDPASNETVTLHWFWDDLVHRSGNPDSVAMRAQELERRFPRSALIENRAVAADFPKWREESVQIARTIAYASGYPGNVDREQAPRVPDAYAHSARSTAERRVTLAGYRLADVLREALAKEH